MNLFLESVDAVGISINIQIRNLFNYLKIIREHLGQISLGIVNHIFKIAINVLDGEGEDVMLMYSYLNIQLVYAQIMYIFSQ